MIKNYDKFMDSELITEAKVAPKVERALLKIGDKIMTKGEFDGVNLDYLTGTILFMREYGNLLVEFDKPQAKFHAGFKDIGKKGHCFYIPLINVASNNEEEFVNLIKKHEENEKNKKERMKVVYKVGDVIVGIGKVKNYTYGAGIKPIDINDEIGIVYYTYDAQNYWIGFVDKFNPTLRSDQDGYPKNGAGMMINKLNMRHANPEEIEKFQKEIEKDLKEIKKLGTTYNIDEVVVVNGNYNNVTFKDNIGVIREILNNGRLHKQYTVQFLEKFNDYLYDVNYIIGDQTGYIVPQGHLRLATEEEIKANETKLKNVKEQIESFNYDYKVGDFIITNSTPYLNLPDLDGQIGEIVSINGKKPRDYFAINFIVRFNTDYIRKNGKWENYYSNIPRCAINIINGEEGREIKRKIENKEIMPFATSPALGMLLNRMNLKPRVALLTNSYFDIDKEKSDLITYLPLDRYKRLEAKDDPYKSKLRQPMKIGKFFRVLNDKLLDKDVEKLINDFRANYDMCVKGVSDQLKLVWGEDVRFWYNGRNYVQGGGILNGSCMRGDNKGPEMQMFVDNPDVIQLLILRDPVSLKLLGRALVWRLDVPKDKVFMDYIYTRYDKDRNLFLMYASQRGWITRDKGSLPNMICALHNDKKYQMGKNALDHFDTFHLVPDQNYLTNGGGKAGYKNPYYFPGSKPGPPPDDALQSQGKTAEKTGEKTVEKPVEKPVTVAPEGKFKEGDKVIYKKEKTEYYGKIATFLKIREDGKYSIVFEDGHKLATFAKYLFPADEKK